METTNLLSKEIEISNLIDKLPGKKNKKSILVGCYSGKLIEFDTLSFNLVKEKRLSGDIINILSTKTNKTIIGCHGNHIQISKHRDFEKPNYILKVQACEDIKFFQDNLITMSARRDVTIFDISTNTKIAEYQRIAEGNITTLCRANSLSILIGDYYGGIYLWNVVKNTLDYKINSLYNNCINSIIKLKRSAGVFASGGYNKIVQVWSIDNNKFITEIKNKRINEANVVTNAYWSKMKELKDGRLVHSCTDYSTNIWDLKSLTKTSMKKHTENVYDYLQIDDNILLSCSADTSIMKWDLRKLEEPCNKFVYSSIICRFEETEE